MINKDSHVGRLMNTNNFITYDDLGNPVFLKEEFGKVCDNYMAQTDKPALVALLDLAEAGMKDLNAALDQWLSGIEERAKS